MDSLFEMKSSISIGICILNSISDRMCIHLCHLLRIRNHSNKLRLKFEKVFDLFCFNSFLDIERIYNCNERRISMNLILKLKTINNCNNRKKLFSYLNDLIHFFFVNFLVQSKQTNL